MASLIFFSSTTLSAHSSTRTSPFLRRAATEQQRASRSPRIKCVADADAGKEGAPAQAAKEAVPSAAPPPRPKKPVYSMKKGQIVRVDKEKYLNSINYLSVGHPPYYKGLDYIYEDRGEVLDLRIFETGEHALVNVVKKHVGSNKSNGIIEREILIEVEGLGALNFFHAQSLQNLHDTTFSEPSFLPY